MNIEAKVLRLFGISSGELKDATRETWPWWREEIARDGTWKYESYPYFPSFSTDDAAAVKLTEQFVKTRHGLRFDCSEDGWQVWLWGTAWAIASPTLGTALFIALEKADE